MEERRRLAGVLENMADGVLITGSDGRVLLINPAAARLLGIDAETALGRPLAHVARDHRIIALWQESIESAEEQRASLEMISQGTYLQVIATPLHDGEPRSSLVIIQDLTGVRRLETMRRDFVSNVSHELRTPSPGLA